MVSSMTAIRFILNGDVRVEQSVPPTMTVLDWLRTRARLTGTKEGCAEGDCGACTVALARPRESGAARWEAVNSCLMMMPQIDGCAVLTVEGLSRSGEPLHPVQQALVDADATQCGYCTPGFAMAMFAFRQGGEPAEDAVIHEALAGNLCRCTGYRAIVDACRKAMDRSHAQQSDPNGDWADSSVSINGGAPATDLPSPLRGGSDRRRRSGVGVAASENERTDPHPQPLPIKGRGAHAPYTPHDDLSRATDDPSRAIEVASQGSAYVHAGQRFLAPASLDELLRLRAQHPDALLLAGGTDLGLRVSKHREALPLVVSTGRVRDLAFVQEADHALEIGAACTYTEALPLIDRRFAAFGSLIRRIGSRQIRNLGTFAGNLVTASPIGDTLPCLIALDAKVTLRSPAGMRTLAVEDFITGYRKTALAPDEIVASVRIPFVPAGEHFSAYKLSKRFDQDISTVIAAFRLALAGDKVTALHAVFGGMAARPARATALEHALIGQPWALDALRGVDALLAQGFSPLSDHRGGAAYRLRAAAGLVRRFQMETASSAPPVRLEAL
jgi:xanthine dehydrogenase small subunit